MTICTNFNRPYLTDLKENISESIQNVSLIDGVKIDYHVIIPTHIHIIIILFDCKMSLGEIVRRFKATSSRITGIKLWQPNYYEHVIRNEKALYKIREYIQNNPLKKQIELDQIYEK